MKKIVAILINAFHAEEFRFAPNVQLITICMMIMHNV